MKSFFFFFVNTTVFVLRATFEAARQRRAGAANQERCYEIRDPLAGANPNSRLSGWIFQDCFIDYFRSLPSIDLTLTDKIEKV